LENLKEGYDLEAWTQMGRYY